MLFSYLPKPIQGAIDLFFTLLVVAGVVAFFMLSERPEDSRRVEDLRRAASEQTGLHCVRVLLADAGAIDCYNGSGRVVLSHTDADGWIQYVFEGK